MMKCMILAAGLGERLRPLTNQIPKPLIKIAGKSLIEHHLERLKISGYKEIVINISYLGDMIEDQLGDGQRFGVDIKYSNEGQEPLDTAGGIVNALPLLGNEPFLVVNADIWCDHSLSFPTLKKENQAHLVLINNPKHNPSGDFAYEYGKIYNTGKNCLTFSGIGIYHPNLFENYRAEKLALAPILREAIDKRQVSAEYHMGLWFDVGTPERLEEAERELSNISRS